MKTLKKIFFFILLMKQVIFTALNQIKENNIDSIVRDYVRQQTKELSEILSHRKSCDPPSKCLSSTKDTNLEEKNRNLQDFFRKLKRKLDCRTKVNNSNYSIYFQEFVLKLLLSNKNSHVVFESIDLKYYDFPNYKFFSECVEAQLLDKICNINNLQSSLNFFVFVRNFLELINDDAITKLARMNSFAHDNVSFISKMVFYTKQILVSSMSNAYTLKVIANMQNIDYSTTGTMEIEFSYALELIKNIIQNETTHHFNCLKKCIIPNSIMNSYELKVKASLLNHFDQKIDCYFDITVYLSSHICAIIHKVGKDLEEY